MVFLMSYMDLVILFFFGVRSSRMDSPVILIVLHYFFHFQ